MNLIFMLNDRERDLFRNDEWLVKIGLSRNPFKLFKNLTILFYFFFPDSEMNI